MGNILSPQEILKIAVEIEENGKNLYGKLENKAKDEKLKKMWKYLKEQEEVHRRTFQKMLDETGDYIVFESVSGEYEAYLRALASEYIITKELTEKKAKEGFGSDLEAVDFGIYVEKESILTYSALKKYVVAEKQSVLDKVIDEEQKHLVELVALRDFLKKER